VYEITLEAVDRDNNRATASVQITVTDAPVASADDYSTPENTQLTVDAPGVLSNDIGPEGAPLSAVLVNNTSNGVLSLNPDGSFVYVPNADFTGVDSFTYLASDNAAESNVVTVSLAIGIVEDPIGVPTDDPGSGRDEDPTGPGDDGSIR
jgi:Bacterial Ig domain